MNRADFETLRDLKDKEISADISFGTSGECAPVLIFDNVAVHNSLGIDLRLSGKYNPLLPSVVFNFRIRDIGPICRYEVNGTMHGDSRTHKHALQREEDPRRNLPSDVKPRPDLENRSPRQVWDIICTEANINFTGTFTDPEKGVAT